MSANGVPCPRCGSQEGGNFCSRCGAALGGTATCRSCGFGLSRGALFCSRCGEPTSTRPAKPATAYLPWILSGLALVTFSVAITLFVRGQATERAPGMPPTGGLPTSPTAEGPGPGAQTPGDGVAGMPSAAELAAMSPREAADRLFDRAMRTLEGGDAERGAFFARMGLQAYGRVPAGERDADTRFHVGLLHLALGGTEAARRESEAILAETPDHLLGLLLGARVAEAAGERKEARRLRERLRAAFPAQMATGRPEYEAHRAMLEETAVSADDAGQSAPAGGEG